MHVYIYIYICMYVCMYVCIHTHVFIYLDTHGVPYCTAPRQAGSGYALSPLQDSRLEYFRQGLGCSEILYFIGSG